MTIVDLKRLAQDIDAIFGFPSTWTFREDEGCYEAGGTINIDLIEVRAFLQDGRLPVGDLELLTTFIMGHEKGHHVQETVWPSRNYDAEVRAMEIEADLMGAWCLNKQSPGKTPSGLGKATRRFNDINRVARPIGITSGDAQGSTSQDYPWPEQREMALIRGETLAALYSADDVAEDLHTFAKDVSTMAKRHEFAL